MNTYWASRAKLTREATIEIMKLLDCKALLAKLTLRTVNIKDPDAIADTFGEILGELIAKVAPEEAVGLNGARAEAKRDLEKDGALIPHCDNCKNDPTRPIDHWDHVAFIDEKSMEAMGHLIITGEHTKGEDVMLIMKTIGILGQWDRSKRQLNESFKPTPSDATVN